MSQYNLLIYPYTYIYIHTLLSRWGFKYLHFPSLPGMLKQVDFTNAQLAQPSHEIADAAHVPFHCVEAIRMISLNL